MCDFCGCPGIEPFATLTEDHGALEALAELFLRNGAVADLEALRVVWADHRRTESALGRLAQTLGLPEVLSAGIREDAQVDEVLGRHSPDAGAVWKAIRGHVETWEFEVFPQLVLSAGPDELEAAARSAAGERGS